MNGYVKTPFKKALNALTPYANKYFPKKNNEKFESNRAYLKKSMGEMDSPLSLEPLVEISERLAEASSFFLFVVFVGVYLALDLTSTRVFGWLNNWSSSAASEMVQSGQSNDVPLASTFSLMFVWGSLPVSHSMNQRMVFLPSQVESTLGAYGPWGRFLYWAATFLEMGGGIALGAIFGMLFSYMITESKEFQHSVAPLLKKISRSTAETLAVLIPCVNVLPLFYSLSLLAENSILLWTVWFYPAVSTILLTAANVLSVLKWSLFMACFAVCLLRLPWVILSWWTNVGRDGRQKIPPTPSKAAEHLAKPEYVSSMSYYQSDYNNTTPLKSKSRSNRASFFD